MPPFTANGFVQHVEPRYGEAKIDMEVFVVIVMKFIRAMQGDAEEFDAAVVPKAQYINQAQEEKEEGAIQRKEEGWRQDIQAVHRPLQRVHRDDGVVIGRAIAVVDTVKAFVERLEVHDGV